MPRTAKDLYIKQLSKLGNGIPLYRPDTVQIGDVGFIDQKDGLFRKVYNIADPPRSDDPGCPPPIHLETDDHRENCDIFYVCYLSVSYGEPCLILKSS